ncbi:MAG: NAD-glutamate dehydrogenase [Hyphomicrobiales bacterium]|nr:NAD-glutamate dehydrogenase [Hyphomicrobiales bacterium]
MHRVAGLIRASSSKSEALDNFTELFFARADASEFDGYSEESLAALVLSAWQFIAARKSGTHKIKVENPTSLTSEHGDLTIIEIANDDMPFLVDSVMGEIQERGLTVHFVSHPVYTVRRAGKNKITELTGIKEDGSDGATRESYIQIHLERIRNQDQRDELKTSLSAILDQVRTAVTDWRAMQDRLNHAIAAYTASPPPVPVSDLAESIQFLKWLLDDNFTLLGMRAFAFVGDEKTGTLEPVPGSGLGILRDRDVYVLSRGGRLVHMTPEIRQFFLAPEPLIVTKANVRSVVHRRTHMDYIGVKVYAESGEISGELRIVGLFTSTAYTRSTRRIPFLRLKTDMVMQRSGYPPSSHSGKALSNILENFPRDELFQIDIDELYKAATGIQQLELRPRTRVFPRIDKFDRFVSVLVYVPRDRFTTGVRGRIGDYLADIYKGRVSAFYLFFPEGRLVRIHFIVGRYEGDTPQPEQQQLEADIAAIARTWQDDLEEILEQREDADSVTDKYRDAFSPAYQSSLNAQRAVEDIDQFDALSADNPVAIRFYKEAHDSPERAHVALYHARGSIPLSRRVPVLENLGFAVIDEQSFPVSPQGLEDDFAFALHDMVLETRGGEEIDLDECAQRLEACFLAVWRGEASDDYYNRLVLRAGLDWRETAIIRGYGSYLRQISSPFGQSYMSDTLVRHVGVTKDLIALFRLRFDPEGTKAEKASTGKQKKIVSGIEAALETIPSLDEDRIFRHFLNLVQASIRTNFYQRDAEGNSPSAIAIKFDSAHVDGAPSPRPFKEIFVFSPRVEGIHLRGGMIARGGLRWSDRAQDFRTEVLGLAKAQQVKNVVIVPTGSKGGFVPKFLPEEGSREEILEEGVACYKQFISSLLTVTDNLVDGKIVPPENVVRHDGDDPYLVVAADKGTATFSDYANEISLNRDFWLGDAFASGGSVGYDHKKMGITARGGWEAVKRHFREMDRDIQTTAFSAIGVGDMSGDVFGNGMLLSKQTRLVAAFDHRDIFIDPDPDAAASWKERKRLFDLARSSWQDYKTDVISAGGGVFSRAAKSIDLSGEIRTLLDIEDMSLTPNELIRAILKSRADLLWFGGIGTYIAAPHETDIEIGDRANDAIRIKTQELQVKVVGEGANLGMTQEARIAFARAGGRVNTDAIDNSAGVNSSDLEVNIKIALGSAVAADKLDLPARNKFLASMTDEVAEACLRNNYLQTLAISLGERNGAAGLGFQTRLMRGLERSGLLNREIEFLPEDGELEERRLAGEGLSRPELAVLFAYAKIELYNELVASKVPDDPYFAGELFAYFPKTLREKYSEEIKSHHLRREIIATRLANSIINRGGSTMFVRLRDETEDPAKNIALAFTAAMAIFDLENLFDEIDALDNKIAGAFQLQLYARLQSLLRQQTAWFLRHASYKKGLFAAIEFYSAGIKTIHKTFDKVITADQRQHIADDRETLEQGGVPAALAQSLSRLRILAERSGKEIVDVARMYAKAADYFRLGALKGQADNILTQDHFDRLAINTTIGTLTAAYRDIVQDIVGGGGNAGFDGWLDKNRDLAQRTRRALDEVLDGGDFTLSKLMVAVGHLSDMRAS